MKPKQDIKDHQFKNLEAYHSIDIEEDWQKVRGRMGKHIDRVIKEGYDIVELDSILKDDLQVFWTDYLDEKMSWER